MARFARVRSLYIVVTRIAGSHGGEGNRDRFLEMRNVAVARYTLGPLLKMECMRKDQTPIFPDRDHIFERIAQVARRAIFVQLLFVTTLACCMIGAEHVCRGDAFLNGLMAIHTSHAHVLRVQSMGEPNARRFIQDQHFRTRGQRRKSEDDKRELKGRKVTLEQYSKYNFGHVQRALKDVKILRTRKVKSIVYLSC